MRHLRFEAFGLVFGVVQLGIAVCQFAPDNEKLEAFGQTLFRIRSARQRGNFDRVIDNKGRIPQFALGATFKQGELQAADARGRRQAFAVFDDFFFQPFRIVQLLVGVVRIVF